MKKATKIFNFASESASIIVLLSINFDFTWNEVKSHILEFQKKK